VIMVSVLLSQVQLGKEDKDDKCEAEWQPGKEDPVLSYRFNPDYLSFLTRTRKSAGFFTSSGLVITKRSVFP